jgi:hypothetical protein
MRRCLIAAGECLTIIYIISIMKYIAPGVIDSLRLNFHIIALIVHKNAGHIGERE